MRHRRPSAPCRSCRLGRALLFALGVALFGAGQAVILWVNPPWLAACGAVLGMLGAACIVWALT